MDKYREKQINKKIFLVICSHYDFLSTEPFQLLLYIVPMNIDGYVPNIINMLDTIERGG